MAEKPVKVDEATHLLVAELAYFLGCTKKTIVREAVAEFAEARARGGAGPERAATFRELPLRARLSLRRPELIREFARHGASGIRLMGRLADEAEPVEDGGLEQVELLVDTDIMDGSSAEPTLAAIASRLLAAPCQVTSATALRLFDPQGLEHALAKSRPL